MRRATSLVVVAGAISVGLAACGGGGQVADLPDDVVAQVGDASVSAAELDRALDQQRAQAEQQGASFPEEGSEGFEQARRQALETLMLQRVVDFEARRCGAPCRVTKSDVDDELETIKTQNFDGSDEQFNAFLDESNITRADARRIVRFQLQQPKLFNQVTRGVRFSDSAARQFYADNKDQFSEPAGRTAAHILVETEAEARSLREQASEENFAELARENSIDTGSAPEGGDLGAIQRGQLVPEFEEVAFKLKDGQISDPVKTQFGWHVIIVQVTPASTTPFGEARQQIKTSQLAARRQEEFTEWRDEIVEGWDERTIYAEESLRPDSAEDVVVPQEGTEPPPADEPPGGPTGG